MTRHVQVMGVSGPTAHGSELTMTIATGVGESIELRGRRRILIAMAKSILEAFGEKAPRRKPLRVQRIRGKHETYERALAEWEAGAGKISQSQICEAHGIERRSWESWLYQRRKRARRLLQFPNQSTAA